MATHENLSRDQVIKGSSNRAFGWTFAVVFLIVALWPVASGGGLLWWAVAGSALFILATLAMPAALSVPNRLWQRFGAILHRVMSPVVLAIMFYAVITPMGLAMRALGKDFLRLHRDKSSRSYWIRREPPGPKPSSMTKQF